MPRVLRIINRLNLGGPTYNAAYLTKYLDPRYETLLVSGMKDESEASSEFIVKQLDIEPVYIESMHRSINPLNDVQAFLEIRKLIKDFKPDIVHTHAAKPGALGRLAAYLCGVPVIIHTFHGHVFHSYFHPLKTRAFIQIEKFLAAISTRIIAISSLQKRELGDVYKICSPEKIEMIPLGFDLSRFQTDAEAKRKKFREKYNLGEDEIAIGIIGRLVPVKNHRLFLEALKITLLKTTKKVRGFIVGDGSEKPALFEAAKELQIGFITDNFSEKKSPLTFTSWITEVDEVTAGLDIVALTSFNEGTPVSLIEAQAANKAIVSTDVGGINDVVVAGETALLSPSGDAEKFSLNLLKLIEDDNFRNRLGKTGCELVTSRFSYNRLAKDMTALYDRLLSSP